MRRSADAPLRRQAILEEEDSRNILNHLLDYLAYRD